MPARCNFSPVSLAPHQIGQLYHLSFLGTSPISRGVTERMSLASGWQNQILPGGKEVRLGFQSHVVTVADPLHMIASNISLNRAGRPLPKGNGASIISLENCPECQANGQIFASLLPERPFEFRIPISPIHKEHLGEISDQEMAHSLETLLSFLKEADQNGYINSTVTFHFGKRGRTTIHPAIIIGLLPRGLRGPAQIEHEIGNNKAVWAQEHYDYEKEFARDLSSGRLNDLLINRNLLNRLLIYSPYPAYTRGQINLRFVNGEITNLVRLTDPKFSEDKREFFEGFFRIFDCYKKSGFDDLIVIVSQAWTDDWDSRYRLELEFIPRLGVFGGEELLGHYVADELPNQAASGFRKIFIARTGIPSPDPAASHDEKIKAFNLGDLPATKAITRVDYLLPKTAIIWRYGFNPQKWPVAALNDEPEPLENGCPKCLNNGQSLAHPRIKSRFGPPYIANLFPIAGGSPEVSPDRHETVFQMMDYPADILRQIPCFPGHLISFLSEEHKTSVSQLTAEEIKRWLDMIQEIEEINFRPQPGISRVSAFINSGRAASGQSLAHIHGQYVAESEGLVLPIDIALRRSLAIGRIERNNGGITLKGHDLPEELLGKDRNSNRYIKTIGGNVHLLAPYAPRSTFALEVVLDRLGASDFLWTTDEERANLAQTIFEGIKLQANLGVTNWNILVAQAGWSEEAQQSTHRLQIELLPRLIQGKRVLACSALYLKYYPVYCPPESWAQKMINRAANLGIQI